MKATPPGSIKVLNLVAVGVLVTLAAQAATSTTTQSISIQISPYSKLSVPGTLTLVMGGTAFQTFSGTSTVSYKARTAPGGSGTVTVQATSDFSPSGGPSVTAGAITYTCGAAGLGTQCSGSQTLSTSSQTTVVTLPASACTGGGGSCSASNPNTVSVTFTSADTPSLKTGSYTAQFTFTISTP